MAIMTCVATASYSTSFGHRQLAKDRLRINGREFADACQQHGLIFIDYLVEMPLL